MDFIFDLQFQGGGVILTTRSAKIYLFNNVYIMSTKETLEQEYRDLDDELEKKYDKWRRMLEAIQVLETERDRIRDERNDVYQSIEEHHKTMRSMSLLDRIKNVRSDWQKIGESSKQWNELNSKQELIIRKVNELRDQYIGPNYPGRGDSYKITPFFAEDVHPIATRMQEIADELDELKKAEPETA